MANHLRQQIRGAVAAKLSGLTTTSTRVYQSRLHPLADSNLPCLLVNTDSEEIATLTLQPHPVMERNLTLAVRCIGKAVANLDDPAAASGYGTQHDAGRALYRQGRRQSR